jgi:hypothetical protein
MLELKYSSKSSDAYSAEPTDPEAFLLFMERSSYEIKRKLTNEAITTKADAVCDFVRDESFAQVCRSSQGWSLPLGHCSGLLALGRWSLVGVETG